MPMKIILNKERYVSSSGVIDF